MKSRINSVIPAFAGMTAMGILFFFGCSTADVSIKKGFAVETVKNVGVMSFSSVWETKGLSFGQVAADSFSSELIKLGFSVVERSQIEKMVQELKLDQTGLVDPGAAKNVGRLAGVDVMVIGSLSPALVEGRVIMPRRRPIINRRGRRGVAEASPHLDVTNINVSAKMIRVETGEILWVGNAQAESSSAQASIKQAVQMICRKLQEELK